MRLRFHVLLGILLFTVLWAGVGVAAQTDTSPLTQGKPVLVNLTAGETRVFQYAPAQTASVTFQAIGDSAPPTLSVLSAGDIVASDPNAGGALTIALTTLVEAGADYQVELSTTNPAGGTLVLVILSEIPVQVQPLIPSVPVAGQMDAASPPAFYSLTALSEPAYLTIESGGLAETSAAFHIVNSATGRVLGLLGPDASGGRFRIPAGTSAFEVAADFSELSEADSYTICFAAISAGACGSDVSSLSPTPAATTSAMPACTVTARAAGGSNVRQSATTLSALLGVLPGGQSANVLGISPDGTFYYVSFGDLFGWISLTVVNASGDCAAVLVVQPPTVTPQPTTPPTPTPTLTPVPPTPTPIPPTATPSGPCLITVTGEFLVYTTPNAIPDFIQDEVQPGYQLIPTGRLADNSWWQTNYFNAWVETSNFGPRAQVTGNCNGLPVVSP